MPVSFDSIDMPPNRMLNHVDVSSEWYAFLYIYPEWDKYKMFEKQNNIIYYMFAIVCIIICNMYEYGVAIS